MELEEIISRCKNNDRVAQALLFKRLSSVLLGICIRYMQDREEAEDVMQDAFVKIFSNLNAFKGEGSFEGWAKKITVNTALNALKKKNRIQFERNLTIVENIEFEEEESAHLNAADILKCMDELPTGYRTIINLVLVEEFSHKDVAEKLNIQESTSRSQYARARQALLKLLKLKTNSASVKNA